MSYLKALQQKPYEGLLRSVNENFWGTSKASKMFLSVSSVDTLQFIGSTKMQNHNLAEVTKTVSLFVSNTSVHTIMR